MLDYIRSNTQSFGVKVAFGIIILVFVFWGVGSFTDMDSSRVMAKVNGEAILEPQFYRQYQLIENQLMQRGLTRQQLKAQHLGRSVLQSMIAHTVVLQEAERLGLDITPRELRATIEQNPLFHNAQGKLDKDSYQRGLNSLRLTAAGFEEKMRQEMLYERLLEMATSVIWVNPTAAFDRYNYLFEKRILDYIYLPAKDFLSECSVTQDEVRTYYDGHQQDFTMPKKATISYILLQTEKLVDPKSISDAELEKWYAKNTKQFTQTEAVRCAHILVRLAQDADDAARKKAQATIAEIQTALKSGKKFADLANKYNEPNAADKDGELGWIERGTTVEPFEKAAFSQKPGTVSETPIETQFGLHLILVHEKRENKVKPLAEVKEEALKSMSAELGHDKLNEVGESLLEDNLLGRDLSKSAARFGLEAVTSEPLSQLELMSKLEMSKEDADLVLSGTPIDTQIQMGKNVSVVRVDSILPEKVKEFAEVQPEIEKKLLIEKGLEKAREKAKHMLEKLSGALTDKEKQKLNVKTSAPIERTAAIEPFQLNMSLNKACFSAEPKTWLPNAYTVSSQDGSMGVLLVYVQGIEKVDPASWERISSIMERGVEQDVAENLRNFFVNELLRTAKITNVNWEKADHMDL